VGLAEVESAAVLVVVGSLAMSLMIKAMISSTAVVTAVSSQSIRRRRRSRLRRRASRWRSYAHVSDPDGIPILPA
jgi:anti-sigma factor RsiW